jgi:hypothetical protein
MKLSSSDHIKRKEMVGHVARMGQRDSFGKSQGKRTFGSHRHRWEDNIKMDLRTTGHGLD